VLWARDREGIRRLLPEADVAFTPFIDRAAFHSAVRLKWVQVPAVGIDYLLFPELIESPVTLTCARGIRARAIAEHVMGVTLALARQLHLAVRYQAAHEWAQDLLDSGARIGTLGGRRMGIVGLGSIGGEVARLATAFGLRVSAVRRRTALPAPEGVDDVLPPERLPDLLGRSDVVVLAAPLTAGTCALIGAAELACVKPGALLVNVARGQLVDDAALVAALREGRLGGAALDVFAHEPLDPASPYWDLPNVIVTPHTSGALEDYWAPLVALFAENLRRFEAGRPLLHVVDKHAGY